MRVASEAIEAAHRAGSPPRAAGTDGSTFHARQEAWLAVALPDVVLPHEPAERNRVWTMCLKRYQNAMHAAAVREETLVDLRPADCPCAPNGGDAYVLRRGLLVSESWQADKCGAIEAVEAGTPQLTPSGKRAVRRIVARRQAQGSESEGEELEDHVHYTVGGDEGGASARKRDRDRFREREKACLRRMDARARALFPGGEGEGEGGAAGGGGEPPRRPSLLLGTAVPPPPAVPPPHAIPASGGGGAAFGCAFEPSWTWGGGGGGGADWMWGGGGGGAEPVGGFHVYRWKARGRG